MKKLFTLITLSLFTAVSFAQSDYYVFCDKEGNVYDNNASITCHEVIDDGFVGLQVPSGLYVKNVDAPSNHTVSVQANITRMDNGNVQLCFPLNCTNYATTGLQAETAKGSMAQGATQNLQTEWLPAAYGECTVVYSLITYLSIIQKATRTITVNYRYADPSGIDAVSAVNRCTGLPFCDLQGRRVSAAARGLSLVRMADGTVRKVVRR